MEKQYRGKGDRGSQVTVGGKEHVDRSLKYRYERAEVGWWLEVGGMGETCVRLNC